MKALFDKIKAEHPLLHLLDPAKEIDEYLETTRTVNPAVHELLNEFITRYLFVSGNTHKGEIGQQIRSNHYRVDYVRDYILAIYPEDEFLFNYYGYVALVKTNKAAERDLGKIDIRFFVKPLPADQEAAAV
jgi:hypothetical protein